jgi:hypothetical protein
VIKRLAARAGLIASPYAGHSLRGRLLTSAAAGKHFYRRSRHNSLDVLGGGYVHAHEQTTEGDSCRYPAGQDGAIMTEFARNFPRGLVGQRLVNFFLHRIRSASNLHRSKPRDDLFGFRFCCAAILLGVSRLEHAGDFSHAPEDG